jgi:hypothetical protein
MHCEFSKKATCLQAEQVKIFMVGCARLPVFGFRQGTKAPHESAHEKVLLAQELLPPIQPWQASSLVCLASLSLASF